MLVLSQQSSLPALPTAPGCTVHGLHGTREQLPGHQHAQHEPGVSDGGDGAAELAVNAPAVVELLVGWPGGALVLDAADAADAHDQDDQHQHKGHAQRPDDDVQGVTRHVGQALCHMPRLPLQICP